jgi:hypothetical protein
MRTGTCENCGAMVKIITGFADYGGKDKHLSGPFRILEALPGQHARPDLSIHLKACPVCGAPRDDTRTMDTPTGDTVDLGR